MPRAGTQAGFCIGNRVKTNTRFVLSVQREAGDRESALSPALPLSMECVWDECVGRKGERKIKMRKRRGGDREAQLLC